MSSIPTIPTLIESAAQVQVRPALRPEASSRLTGLAGTPRVATRRLDSSFDVLARWWTRGRWNRLTISLLKQHAMQQVSRHVDASIL